MYKLKFVIILLSFSLLISCQQHIPPTTINSPELLKEAEKLPQSGELKTTRKGFVYLQVSNDFKTKLFPILVNQILLQNSKCIQMDKNKIGAHVSLFYPHTLTQGQRYLLPLGQKFHFRVLNVIRFKVKKIIKDQIVYIDWYVIAIESPELSALIKQFEPLRPKPILHITFASAYVDEQGVCLYQK